MANEYVNKVIINGETKVDLTSDTVSPSVLLSGYTAHDASGATIEGSMSIEWGDITGTLSDQTDLNTSLNSKWSNSDNETWTFTLLDGSTITKTVAVK